MLRNITLIFIALMLAKPASSQLRSISWEKFNMENQSGLRQIGKLETKLSKDSDPSLWSIGCETLDRGYGKFANYKDLVGDLGVKSARIQSGWATCEREKGKYSFEWLDTCVNGLTAQGVKPWMCLCYGNSLYGSSKLLGSKIFTDAIAMAAWLKYVEQVVMRYRNTITEWEVWNEPNLNEDNRKFPEAYANLLINTSKVIKKIQPEAKVIGFSLSGMPLPFTRSVFEVMKSKKQLKAADYLSFHPYTYNPDDINKEITDLYDLARLYNPDIKFFQGECGVPSNSEVDHALAYYPWTEFSQPKWLLRRMTNDWMHQTRSSIFTIVDLQYPNMLQSFGLLRANLLHEILYKRPSYYAVKHMVNFFNSKIIPAGNLKHEANTSRSLSVIGFNKDQEKPFGILIWYNDKIPGDDLSQDRIDIIIKDIAFKNPVYVELITGRVYEIAKYNIKSIGNDLKISNLPVWDSPVIVAERAEVSFN